MRLRVTLVGGAAGTLAPRRDLQLGCSANTRVAEVARALLRAGAGNGELMAVAARRTAPFTLRVTNPGSSAVLLDGAELLRDSGVRSGASLEPVLESMASPEDDGWRRFTRPPVARMRVLSGAQTGVEYLLPEGEALIGRTRGNRIELMDSSVSRTHARIEVYGDRVVIHDLDSVNGTRMVSKGRPARPGGSEPDAANGVPLMLRLPGEVEFGIVRVRFELFPWSTERVLLPEPPVVLTSPRVESVYDPEPLDLPTPPEDPEPAKFPLVATITPIFAAIVLFALTRSPFSLVFAALAPFTLIGSWLDSRGRARRTHKGRERAFLNSLGRVRSKMSLRAEEERTARLAESPGSADLIDAPAFPDSILWSRSVEHRPFLECRLGLATLESRQGFRAANRSAAPSTSPLEEAVQELQQTFRVVQNVPVTDRLGRCGSLGVCGETEGAESLVRSLIVQIAALHSPAQVVLAAIADADQAARAWSWLKWLPHVNSAFSPLRAPHLAADPGTANELLGALEALVHTRTDSPGTDALRSHLPRPLGDANDRRRPVTEPGHLPRVILLVLSVAFVDQRRLVQLLGSAPDAGVHCVWLAKDQSRLPAACRTAINITPERSQVDLVRHGRVVALTQLEALDLESSELFARALAPILDGGAMPVAGRHLPATVHLTQLLPAAVSESQAAVRDRWRSTLSLVREWTPDIIRTENGLRAVVGLGPDGPVELDLRVHGPHALIAGTTGSGKSEFLQSWIVSLATSYSPDRLNFLLFDYKGGSAFSVCSELPHVVGLVTDLDPREVERAFTSLRAELLARERLLRAKGVPDLATLERRNDPEAPANLIIVVDEFAALAAENPKFVPGLLDIAQRGRSLGLHAILGTQRPTGVISDALRANTNLHVALRTTDAGESTDIIGTPEAAEFPIEAPGRAAVRIGGCRPLAFQAGYIGGVTGRDLPDEISITDLGFAGSTPRDLAPEVHSHENGTDQKVRDLDRLVSVIRAASHTAGCATPRRPWVEPLSESLVLDEILDPAHQSPQNRVGRPPRLEVALGMLDEPTRQRQGVFSVDLTKRSNLLVFGAPHSGKTTALITAACSLARTRPDARIYGLDCAGGALAPLAELPHTGAIIGLEERNRVGRLLRLLREMLDEPAAMSSETRGNGRATQPPTLLLIDELSALEDGPELSGGGQSLLSAIAEITRTGRSAGIHVVAATSRRTGVPSSLVECFGEQLALRLAAGTDAQFLGLPAGPASEQPAGRAFQVGTHLEIQLALPFPVNREEADRAIQRGLKHLAHVLAHEQAGFPPAKRIPSVPARLLRSDLPPSQRQPFGFAIDTAQHEPIGVPGRGILLVTGPAGSGRSTAVLSMLESMADEASATGRTLETALLTPHRSTLGEAAAWHAMGDDPETRRELAALLVSRCREAGRGPGQGKPGRRVAPGIGGAGPSSRRVVVIEDLGAFDGSGEEATLAALLKALRHSENTVIVEGENATIGSAWELATPLKGARWAIALRPDANDTPSVFTSPFAGARRGDFAPGHGYLLHDGHLTPIQVALARPRTTESAPLHPRTDMRGQPGPETPTSPEATPGRRSFDAKRVGS